MKDLSPLVLGLDSSTTACKANVWDCRGRSIAKGYSSLALLAPQPAWHEQPAESWWESMTHAIRQAVSQVGDRRLKALCIAHQRETFVPLDEHDRPLINGILWMDERARDLLPFLEQTLGRDKFHRLTGKRLSVNLTIAKIAWLKAHRADVFAQTRKYVDVHAFLVHRLTGSYRTGWGSADPTGLFDIQNNCWAESLLDQIDIRLDQLPEVYPPGTIIGSLIPAAAEACGLPVGLPVVAGIGDGQASGLGVNIASPGDAYLSMGTSVISGTMTGGVPGSYLLETVQLGGGYTVAWFMEKIAGQPGHDVASLQDFYDQAASAVPPGSALAGSSSILEQRARSLLGSVCQRYYCWLARFSSIASSLPGHSGGGGLRTVSGYARRGKSPGQAGEALYCNGRRRTKRSLMSNCCGYYG